MKLFSTLRQLTPMVERLRWNVVKALLAGEKELTYVNALCDRSRISLDVGANRGVYSYLMRRHSKSVIAFEPNPYYADFVRRALKDVQVIEAAVSDHKGTSALRVPLQGAVAGMGTIEAQNALEGLPAQEIAVSIVTLDSLELPRVGFMKIDVEGHELAALRGATAVIERDLPNFLIEAEERHRKDAAISVLGFLANYGYQGFFHEKGRLHPIEAFQASTHQNTGSDLYVNNFMFVHKSKMAHFCAVSRISVIH